jgi:hypothetical protein
MTQLADTFMAIFGFKRVASVQGNVVTPTAWDECGICGEDHECNVPRECETGDGV